jgi:hypothetical protein
MVESLDRSQYAHVTGAHSDLINRAEGIAPFAS